MKFLVLVIWLMWTHYGNASGYFLNDELLVFERDKESFYVPQGSSAAIRMNDHKIEFIAYKNNSDSEMSSNPDGTFWWALSGVSCSFSLPEPSYTFTGGFNYQFHMTVFDNAESITFEAPDDVSLLRRLLITRKDKGSIGFCGELSFTNPFECMKGVKDHWRSDILSSLGLSPYFLIEGADTIELHLQ